LIPKKIDTDNRQVIDFDNIKAK